METKQPRFWADVTFTAYIVNTGEAIVPITGSFEEGNINDLYRAAMESADINASEMGSNPDFMRLDRVPRVEAKIMKIFPSKEDGSPDFGNPI